MSISRALPDPFNAKIVPPAPLDIFRRTVGKPVTAFSDHALKEVLAPSAKAAPRFE
jgi:hypothetical protein